MKKFLFIKRLIFIAGCCSLSFVGFSVIYSRSPLNSDSSYALEEEQDTPEGLEDSSQDTSDQSSNEDPEKNDEEVSKQTSSRLDSDDNEEELQSGVFPSSAQQSDDNEQSLNQEKEVSGEEKTVDKAVVREEIKKIQISVTRDEQALEDKKNTLHMLLTRGKGRPPALEAAVQNLTKKIDENKKKIAEFRKQINETPEDQSEGGSRVVVQQNTRNAKKTQVQRKTDTALFNRLKTGFSSVSNASFVSSCSSLEGLLKENPTQEQAGPQLASESIMALLGSVKAAFVTSQKQGIKLSNVQKNAAVKLFNTALALMGKEEQRLEKDQSFYSFTPNNKNSVQTMLVYVKSLVTKETEALQKKQAYPSQKAAGRSTKSKNGAKRR